MSRRKLEFIQKRDQKKYENSLKTCKVGTCQSKSENGREKEKERNKD